MILRMLLHLLKWYNCERYWNVDFCVEYEPAEAVQDDVQFFTLYRIVLVPEQIIECCVDPYSLKRHAGSDAKFRFETNADLQTGDYNG